MIKYFTNNTFKTIKEMTKEELKTWETKLEEDLKRNRGGWSKQDLDQS